jgi:uncharacterized SAM-binding protein YcdF (DUF218 family)
MTQKKTKRSILRNPFFIVLLVFISGSFIGLFYRAEVLSIPALILVRNDAPPPTHTHIVLLMGDNSGRRAKAAFKLWEKNPHTQIVFMREKPEGFVTMGLAKGRDELHTEYFLREGVPTSKIVNILDCQTTSTFDEARCLKNFVQSASPRPQNIVIITEWYHSARAGWLFEKVFANTNIAIHMHPAATDDPSKGVMGWWNDEEMFLRVFEEYLKWTYWRIKDVFQ